MKKKNLAMAMAAITVAAPVAQMAVAGTAFAAEQTMTADEAVKKVGELLAVKYTDPRKTGEMFGDASVKDMDYTNSVYSITVDGAPIKDTDQLRDILEQAKIGDSKVTIEVENKGFRVDASGNKVATELSKNVRYDAFVGETVDITAYDAHVKASLEAIKTDAVADAAAKKAVDKVVEYNEDDLDIATSPSDTKVDYVEVTLVNGKKIVLDKYSDKLNFKKPVDVNGNYVELKDANLNTTEGLKLAKNVVGFEVEDQDNTSKTFKEYDIKKVSLDDIVVANNSTTISNDLSAYYNGAYTEDGKDLLKDIAKKVSYKDGKKYNLANIKIDDIDSEKGVYSLEITGKSAESGKTLPAGDNLSITVKTTDQTKLKDFKADLDIVNAFVLQADGTLNAGDQTTLDTMLSTGQRFETLAGKNRFETAVEVSKAYAKKLDTAGEKPKAVVLVGFDAVTDGLAAAPFAAEKKAPVLLSQKDSVPAVIMDEMKSVLKAQATNDTVYIVGGKDIISEKAEAQILKELKELNKNIKIERISGENRFETSVAIAKKMTVKTDAYVVGGFGEADAMSIAPLAVKNEAPIIVSPQAGLTTSAKDFFEREESIKDVRVIGGADRASAQVMADVKAAAGERKDEAKRALTTLTRVSGTNRQDTNAKVLALFSKANDVQSILVAKDGMASKSQLVDALTASVLGQPIVLNTNGLTDDQETAIEAMDDNTANATKATQVGFGVTSKVMDRIVTLFGNTK